MLGCSASRAVGDHQIETVVAAELPKELEHVFVARLVLERGLVAEPTITV